MLVSDSPVVRLPAAITIPAGGTMVRFFISTQVVAAETIARITATNGEVSGSSELTVLPREVRLTGLSLTPDPVVSRLNVKGTVMLDCPAPDGGLLVSLVSTQPSVAGVPTTVRVAPGSTSAGFVITTARIRTTSQVTISATVGMGTVGVPLTVLPAGIIAFTISTASVVGGQPITGSVLLYAAAPPEGAVVTLASDRPDVAVVPAQVTVPAGARSAPFVVQTSPVPGTTPVTVTASYAGESRIVSMTVRRR
jgi:hypothetical protein